MNEAEPSIEIGIAICTYNPDERLLQRTLNAVASLEIPSELRIECVIVDNHSDRPVSELPLVREFLSCCRWARVTVERRPGLSYARIAAIDSTTATLLCFVDDDNEPARDYLSAALRILSKHPCIGAIGPGKVSVDFVDPVSDWFARRFSHHFQEKDREGLAYGSVAATWTDYYPAGSCMVVRREVLTRYRSRFLAGELAASDRVGQSLSSGGDTQIVWEAVKMGLAAGVSSELRLTHMIPGTRSNLHYVKRLCYGTSSSYLPALVSCFPAEKSRYLRTVPSDSRIARAAIKIIACHVLQMRFKLLPIELAVFFGSLIGNLRATGTSDRAWVQSCVKLLRLE